MVHGGGDGVTGAARAGRAAAGPRGSLDISPTDPHTGALRATVTGAELTRLARRGCRQHPPPADRPSRPDRPDQPPRPDRPDDARPSPVADCGCPVLDRPPPVERYQPSPAQRRYVRARDRTCRHPGCRRPAARTDLDHVRAHRTGGPTDCTDLCCLCRRHHRLKTHARGWRFTMTEDGTLTVTTPSGVTRCTRPPGTDHLDDLRQAPDSPTVVADDPPPC